MSDKMPQINPRKQHFRSSMFTTNIMGKFYEDSSLSKELKVTNYKLESVKRRYNQKVILLHSLQRSLNNVNQYMNSLSNKRLKFLLTLREEKFKHIIQLAGPIVLKSVRNYYLKQKKKEEERRNNSAITIQCWLKQRKAVRLYKLLKKKKFVKDLFSHFLKYKRNKKFKRSLQCVVGCLKLNRKRCIKKREAQRILEPIFLTETSSNFDPFSVKVREIKSKLSTDFDNNRRGGYRSRGYSMGVSLISTLPKSTSRNSPLSKLSQGPKDSTIGTNISTVRSSSPLKVNDQTPKQPMRVIQEQPTNLLRTALTNQSTNKHNQTVHRRRANTRIVDFNFETSKRTNDSRNQEKAFREDKKKRNKSQHSTNKSTRSKYNVETSSNDNNKIPITNYTNDQDNLFIPDKTLPIKVISITTQDMTSPPKTDTFNNKASDCNNTQNDPKTNDIINSTDNLNDNIVLFDNHSPILENQPNTNENNDSNILATTPMISFSIPDTEIPPNQININDFPLQLTDHPRNLNRMSSSPNLRVLAPKELTKSVSSTLGSTEGKGDTSSRVIKISEIDTQLLSQHHSTDLTKDNENDLNQIHKIDRSVINNHLTDMSPELSHIQPYDISSPLQRPIKSNNTENVGMESNIDNNSNINKNSQETSNNISGHSTNSQNIISINNSPPLINVINNNTIISPGGISFGNSQLEYTSFQLSSTSSSDDDPFDFNIFNSPILSSSNNNKNTVNKSSFLNNDMVINNSNGGLNLTVDVEFDSEIGEIHDDK